MSQFKSNSGVLVPSDRDDEAGLAAIREVLAGVNGRASKHTFSARAIVRIAQEAEESLDDAGATERERVGTTVEATSGGPLASSYNGTFVCTVVTIRRREDGWYLTFADADQRHAGKGAGERVSIEIRKAVSDAIQKRAISAFRVREPRQTAAIAADYAAA